jgi:pimeloyl-ACP methyl ester carboxylesterase
MAALVASPHLPGVDVRLSMTSVPVAAGALRAVVWRPDDDRLLPGVVLVDGALEGIADATWEEFAAVLTGCGAVALSHDKPGCGGSPGDWREQSLEDRAQESLAAVEVLRRQPGVDPRRVGLLGVSQGGWVSWIAASMAPVAVNQVVSVSGPGVSPAEQERYRIERAVSGNPEAMAWVDERTRRVHAGEARDMILASQRAYAVRPWYEGACAYYDQPELFPLLTRIFAFDPAAVLPLIRCPVFTAYGGDDDSVSVQASVQALSRLLPADSGHALAVYPHADHGIQIPGTPERSLAERLAPGFIPMLAAWLSTTPPSP